MDVIEKRSLLFTNKALVAMTVPVILETLLSVMAGMVDSAMVSSAGEAAVSAVSLVDAINLLFTTTFSGLITGGSVVLSQYIGKRDQRHACITANQLLYLSTGVATVFMVILLCFHAPLLRLIYGSVEPVVFESAKIYFLFTLLGYPFFALGYSSTTVLRSTGLSRQAVFLSALFNVLNVIGNSILIYGFKMGVAGAAIATTLGRIIYSVLGVWRVHDKTLPAYFEKLRSLRLDFDVIRRIVRIGVANGSESALFYVGKLLITSLVATFGTIAIAANSVASSINNIGWVILGGFGTVLLPVVGQCIGAGEVEQAILNVKKMLKAATVTMITLFGTVFLLRYQLVRLFDFKPEALDACAYYTGVLALLSIASCYSLSFVPMSAFRAAGDVRYTVAVSLFTMFTFRVGMCFLLNAIFPTLGLMCVYIGMFTDWFIRSVLNFFRFRSGKWIHKRLV